MIDERYLEFIQADIDGELPDEHRAELSRFLLASPEARAVRDELKRVSAALDGVAPAEPPPELRASILSAVRPAARSSSLRGFWPSRGTLRYAAVFAGGLLVSSIAFQLGAGQHSAPDVSQVAGTMASRNGESASGPVDTISVSLEQVRGSVSLFRSQTARVVEFDLVAKQPVEVVVAHDGQEARFSGLGKGEAGGAQRYALVIDGAGQEGAPIELRFLASGTVVHRDVLVAPASR